MKTLVVAALSALFVASSMPSSVMAQSRGPTASAPSQLAEPDRAQHQQSLRSAMGNPDFAKALVNRDQRSLQQIYARAGGRGNLSFGPTEMTPSGHLVVVFWSGRTTAVATPVCDMENGILICNSGITARVAVPNHDIIEVNISLRPQA
jgi:hypothetical protein